MGVEISGRYDFERGVGEQCGQNCGTQAKRIRGDPANAGAGEATAPSEWWGDNLFFCRRWDPHF